MRNSTKHSLIHHFADDTNLMCSDKDPSLLRLKMNEDLTCIFDWLCANRLSLNVLKTEFIVFKPPNKSLSERITLKLNDTTIYESKKIKYLGIILDDRLTWKYHIAELCKKLSTSIGIIRKIKKLCPKRVQIALYFSLFQSHLNYGACVWGNSKIALQERLQVLQKSVVRTITNSDKNAHSSPLFKELKILKFDDILKMQLGCLMWDYDHGNLPICFNKYFKKIYNVHKYGTRSSKAGKLSQNVTINTSMHGGKLFKYTGIKMLNYLRELQFYNETKTLHFFRNKFKAYLINQY